MEYNKILIKLGKIKLPLRVFRPPCLNFQPQCQTGGLGLAFCFVNTISRIINQGSISVINYLYPPFIWELFLLNYFSSPLDPPDGFSTR